MLPARLVLFAFFQALFAAGFWLAGANRAWKQSAAWWPFTVTLTNLTCLWLMTRAFLQEGRSYWTLFRFDRAHWKGDLLALLGLMIIAAPVAMLPNNLLARALYGDALAPMRQFLLPLPAWALYAGMLLFPVTQGLVELAFYFLYLMPRLTAETRRPWLGYVLASLFLGLQHLSVPLVLDGRFIAWRGLMFIPFAFFMGAIIKWRPRLFPYLAIGHALIDFATMTMYLTPF
jgi:hypothetical protein